MKIEASRTDPTGLADKEQSTRSRSPRWPRPRCGPCSPSPPWQESGAILEFRNCAANLSFFTKFFWAKLHSWIPNLSDDVILSRIELVNAANLEINFLDHPEFQILGKLEGADLNSFNQWESGSEHFRPMRNLLNRSPRQWHEVAQFGKSWG